jgi:hypothetical protein
MVTAEIDYRFGTGAERKAKDRTRARPSVNPVQPKPDATRSKERLGSLSLGVKVPVVSFVPWRRETSPNASVHCKRLSLWKTSGHPLVVWSLDADPRSISSASA